MLAKISAIGGTLLVAVVILAVVFTGCTKIDQTEYCIETRFGKVVDEHMATGMALTVFSEATCFPLTDVNFPATGQTETIDAQTADPVTVTGDVGVVYAYDPTSVNRLRAGETSVWDFININNPWARTQLWPEGLIRDLPQDRFQPLYEAMMPKFAPPYHWAMSQDGEHLLGVVQRYETFDFVVNSDVISPELAKNEGWDLFNNPDFSQRYGILAYEDWNVMDICMGAGVHPFKPKSDEDIAKFEATAKRWIDNAKLITTDFVQLNLGIINGEIDLYFTGGSVNPGGGMPMVILCGQKVCDEILAREGRAPG